jgi:tRNA(fMet)-specific endonuclease VapC
LLGESATSNILRHVFAPIDLMIAGQARSRGLTVVTGNLEEFQRVQGLRCEDWLAA